MNHHEILLRYKYETASEQYRKIHKKFKNDSARLYCKYEIKNYVSAPLAIIAVIILICIVFSVVCRDKLALYILICELIIVLSVRTINKKLVNQRNFFAHVKGSPYSEELEKLKYHYLNYYDSVIGFVDNVNDFCCDCEENCDICKKQN